MEVGKPGRPWLGWGGGSKSEKGQCHCRNGMGQRSQNKSYLWPASGLRSACLEVLENQCIPQLLIMRSSKQTFRFPASLGKNQKIRQHWAHLGLIVQSKLSSSAGVPVSQLAPVLHRTPPPNYVSPTVAKYQFSFIIILALLLENKEESKLFLFLLSLLKEEKQKLDWEVCLFHAKWERKQISLWKRRKFLHP